MLLMMAPSAAATAVNDKNTETATENDNDSRHTHATLNGSHSRLERGYQHRTTASRVDTHAHAHAHTQVLDNDRPQPLQQLTDDEAEHHFVHASRTLRRRRRTKSATKETSQSTKSTKEPTDKSAKLPKSTKEPTAKSTKSKSSKAPKSTKEPKETSASTEGGGIGIDEESAEDMEDNGDGGPTQEDGTDPDAEIVVPDTSRSCKQTKSSKGCTYRPTMSPTTSAPTKSPSPTMAPTLSPTASPTTSPTSSPTVLPTGSTMPTIYPTTTPTESLLPSADPTSQPTQTESLPPSQSSQPTTIPSMSPSESMAPTGEFLSTTRGDSDSNGLPINTECLEKAEESGLVGTTAEQSLAYDVNVYLSAAAAGAADLAPTIAALEARIHDAMVASFMDCQYEAPFGIQALSTEPIDVVRDGVACDMTNDPDAPNDSVCFVIRAGTTMTVFFPTTRRRSLQDGDENNAGDPYVTNATPEVREEVQGFLQPTMANGDYNDDDVAQVAFQGFIDVAEEGRDTSTPRGDGGDGGVDGFIADPVSTVSRDTEWVSGAVIIAAALLLLILLVVLIIRRANRRHDEFAKQLDDDSNYSFEYGHGNTVSDASDDMDLAKVMTGGDFMEDTLSMEGKNNRNIVGGAYDDDDDDSYDDRNIFFSDYNYEHAHPNVHICASATCEICQQRRVQPTFMPTERDTSRIQEDLGPVQHRRLNPEVEPIPDTVRL